MSDCSTIDTPIESKLNLEKSECCTANIPYQRLIGSLMYLAVLTRPDLSYCLSYLSQFNNCYNETHFNYAKRILKYLQKTKHYCLTFSKTDIGLTGFVDADWASDSLDRKSYTGFCFVMNGCVISWQSRKQKTVSLSSTEAEYVALSEAAREAVYLRNVMFDITGKTYAIKLLCDNQSALKLATSHQAHTRSKHIDVRFHYVRDAVENKLINIEYISTQEMPADLLTKGLLSAKHYKFMNMLGLKEAK
ncbi:secreted RxLR effector protein 161-like [Papilio machaon]|uniref:secreted RxLR effector protein 161-like n=1 Tax=Papilio machaon TaxID=76193 RepID=UPI001E664F86|nr:secreted RxLR effector protein 161-like [Papilio machaon]